MTHEVKMTDEELLMHLIGGLIRSKVRALESERHFPGFQPDESDDRIKKLQEHVINLRTMRENLELMFGEPRV